MRTPHRLLALTAVAAVAAGGAWLASRWLAPTYSGPSPALAAEPAAASPVAESPVAESSVSMIAPEALGEPRENTREVVPESSPKAMELPELKIPADAIWVEGRVIFPRDTPPDEHVRVVTRGRTFPGTNKRRTHEVELAADGSFRAAFAPKTRTGYVRLEAQYLYLGKSVKVDARELPSEVLLEPQLGARVLLTVTPPTGADPGDLDGVSVQAYVEGVGNQQMFVPQVFTENENGVFALTSLKTGGTLQANVICPTWCDRHLEIAGLQAGETREVVVALIQGARLTGRTLDADGAPVKGAQIWAMTERSLMEFNEGTVVVGAMSDDDGGFDLRGVALGTVALQASHVQYLEQSLEFQDLQDGEQRLDLELCLEQGGVVSGLVQWPDGRPVAGARVEVHQERDEEEGDYFITLGPDSSVKSDADGRFRVTGLGDGPCTVRARARPERDEEEGEAQGLLARRRSGLSSRRGPYWRVTVLDVLPSESELVLVLRSGGAISGRVVDDVGHAVEKFKVRVQEPGSGRFYGFDQGKSTTVSQSFKAEDGSFALEGVPEGEWIATASARGYGSSGALPVSVPQSGGLVLVIPREATVAGVVLAPDGSPLRGARFEAELERNGLSSWSDPDGDRTGKDGSFKLSLAPGKYEIHGTHDEYAESVREMLELGPGEFREGIVLTLRRAARITGTLDPSVGELAGRDVNLNHVEGPGWDSTSTDDRGRFRFEGLEPGMFELILQETREVVGEHGDTSYFSENLSSLSLELREGEERQVVLGAALASAVRVSGRVTAGGTPVSGLSVTWNPFDFHDGRAATTDEVGRYELDMVGTGRFRVTVGRGWDEAMTQEVEVPEKASTFEFDVELPTARVSGRLVGPDGEPVGEADVTLQWAKEDSHLERSTESSEDGTFVFQYVEPGTYVLTASDSHMHFYGGSARFGAQRIDDLQVPEAGVDGLELQLLRSASIEGTVLHVDGTIVPNCYVSITQKGEHAHATWNTAVTDRTGRFVCGGLGPGTYLIYAEEGSDSSAKHEVRLTEGATYALDLTLDR